MCPNYQIISSYLVRGDINMCRHRDRLRWHLGNILMEWLMLFINVFANLVSTDQHHTGAQSSVKIANWEMVRPKLYTSVLSREYEQVML